MARIKDILTEAPQHVSFFFGRCNPPHHGHEALFKTTMATAKNGAWAGFVSKSHDAKKNPLSYNDKIKWIYAIFPFMQGHLVEDPAIKTVLAAAAHLYDKGFRSATFIAGEDDMPQMRKLLEDYNGAEGKSHGFYKFEPLTFSESPRLTSATNARQAAQDNNPEAFELATRVKPNITVDGKTLFQAVRSGMGLGESITESKHPDLYKAFEDFLPVAMKTLHLKNLPKIKLEKHVAKHDQPTFARYVNDEYTIHLGIDNRHPLDILRTLAHELVHYKQHQTQQMDNHSGDTGSSEENTANAEAGIIMRDFDKKHPGYFADSAVSLDENFKDHKGPGRPGDAKRHGVPTKASVSTLRKVAKQGGRKGQLAHWMANMKAGKKKAAKEDYGATNPVSQLADRAVAVMPFDRFAVKMDENWEPNLFEVSMSPGALNDFAKSEAAQTMTIGFEMELAMPDLPEGNGSYSGESEAEDDMEYNDDFPTGAGWRDDVITWLEGGDNPNYTRDVERTMEWFDEQFFEYADEMFANALDEDEYLQEEVRNEIADILAKQSKPSDADAIAAEYDEQTDIYTDAVDRVKEGWQENKIDDAFDDFCMQYRIRDMEDFLNYVNRNHPRISLHWPYQTYSGGDGEGGDQAEYLQDVANELETKLKRVNSDFYVVVSDDYHDESREINKFIIEPDGSITPQGREFISPAMQFADGIAAMEMMFVWAESNGYRTNQSTGFHMGISLPNHETQNIDHMKFILMLGDAHVLEKFNRAKAHYAVNTVNTMRDTLKRGDRVKKEEVAGYLRQMATGMQDLATTELNKLLVPRGEHRQSVNIKSKYMEIRSAGDNYLPRFSDIRLTLLRYLRTLEISADDQAYRREYAKKLSKFLTSTEMIRTVDPVTGRKSVASKDSLDKTVQQAFDQYFAALQNGESGDAAIAALTDKLNQYKGNKVSQLKQKLVNKRANADPSSVKLKYQGADRVEFSAKGNAYDVLNSFIEQLGDAGIGDQRQRVMFMETPKGQILYNIEFTYTGSTRKHHFWCFAPDKGQAIAQAKKAWNINSDQPGDSWLAYQQSGDVTNVYYTIRNFLSGSKTPPDDRAYGSLAHTRPATAQDQLYSIRSPDDAGVRTFNAANDAEASQYARQFFAQNSNYNQDNTVLYRYDNNGTDRDQVSWQPEQPVAGDTPSTFIITYLGPTGNEQQTAYDANSATEAATLFRLQHPSSYQIHQITRLQESVSEITETLKKVRGKWALVSRHKPEKVLQYYHGSGHPSKEWVSKVERRVHSFESQIVERRETFTDIMPDGDITYTWHREERSQQRKIHFKDLIDLAQDAVKLYKDELAQHGDGSFVIKRKSDGLGIGIIKTQRPNGSYGYHVATTHYNFKPRPGQKVFMVEAAPHANFKVYLDMDGVLADFFGEWARLDGKDHYKDIDNPQAKLELIRKHPTFWVNLPMLPHARELILTVKELFGEYYICSKPLEGDPRSEPGKMAWIRDHLADMPPAGVILTHNKAQHANTGNGPNILIDDYGVNVNAWKMAGGIALKYEDTKSVSNFEHIRKVLTNFAKTGVQL